MNKDEKGMYLGENEYKMGWNEKKKRKVIFEKWRVKVENSLGDEGVGLKIEMKGIDGGRINIEEC